jgi:subtilisin family serine protease
MSPLARAGCIIVVVMVTLAIAVPAFARKPKLPPGRDPGGAAIAVADTGIDYTRPDFAARLARDGEGELIGWDMVDRDNRPFTADEGISALYPYITPPDARLVPIRVTLDKPHMLGQAVAFTAQTPARILLLPLVLGSAHWAVLHEAAQRFRDVVIVVAVTGATDVARDADSILTIASADVPGTDIALTDGVGDGAPAEIFGRFLEQLRHCAGTSNGRPLVANVKLQRLLSVRFPTGKAAAQGSPAACGLRALRP